MTYYTKYTMGNIVYKQKKSKETIDNKANDENKKNEERIKEERAKKVEILLYQGGFLEEMCV